ncbi:MAG: DegT/DnrJ/EryC1/StrS family aminotransferase [Bacteroidetes bacterium]|nr:DegT/DnrJ/EryC1/StrS family aminotransferase [Bacteroidota bacterium]MBL6963851.1 DegT/DnrJ/EryC1/StrS family aminotransferase [Bacteroidota bacterium]
MIDLRSDTLTKPTAGMLEAMIKAEVGDDVWGEDPSVNELEKKVAEMFGMEAALFCPSGTMTNQIAIKVHTQAGDEVICDRASHVYNFEAGGIAFNSAASMRLIHGDRGRFTAKDVLENINPDDIHFPVSRLVSVENTVNRGGGCFYHFEDLKRIRKVCTDHGLSFHLDGARLFNALVETREKPEDYGQIFDTISICLSKGLGAPVGSLLIGSSAIIVKGRRIRKIFGGAMRQAGFLAAAGIYALDHHIDRLADDHRRAKVLSSELAKSDCISTVLPVDTNIVIFNLQEGISDEEFLDKLKQKEVLMHAIGKNSIRLVTHLDFNDDMLEKTINVLKQY